MISIDLSGKSALITGGTRGIGAAIARRLAEAGASLYLNYRDDQASADRLRIELEAAGSSVTLLKANLVHPDEIRAMFALIGSPLDILVHNAALGSFRPLLDLRANQWDLSLNVNARAFLLCAQNAASSMPQGGRMIAISSLGSIRAIPSYGAIGISKAALEASVRALAAETAPKGITVNAVCAGIIESTSLAAHPGYDDLSQAALKRTPMGRLGRPEEIADAVVFFCSDLSGWITGHTLVLDGGMSIAL